MKNIKASMGIVDKEFARNVISKYASFSINRHLAIFKSRISAFLDRIEFVYALPFMVIRRSISILEKISVVIPIRHVRNLLSMHLGPTSWHRSLFLGVPSIGVDIFLDKSSSDQFQTMSLGKIVRTKQIKRLSREVLLHGPRMASSMGADILHACIVKALQFADQGILKLFTEQVRHRRIHLGKVGVIRSSSGSDVDKRPSRIISGAYPTSEHTYVTTEHVVRGFPQIIRETKERVVEKAMTSQPQVQSLRINVNRLADQIYQLLERKVRIERERRGLL